MNRDRRQKVGENRNDGEGAVSNVKSSSVIDYL
jgi:hypothetical protein